jgi:hypothetical protein
VSLRRTTAWISLAVLSAATLPSAASAATVSPLAYWSFDNGTGSTTLTDVVGGHNGTLTNMDPSTDWIAGHSGAAGDYALDFDGSNDFVALGVQAALSSNKNQTFSVSTWVYDRSPSGTGGTMGIVGTIDSTNFYGWEVARQAAGPFVRFEMTSTTANKLALDSSAYPVNQWVHVAVTYDGSDNANGMKVYINGVPSGTINSNVSGGALPTTNPAAIGSYGGTSRYFNGKLDDTAIFGTVLTPNAVKQLAAGASSLAIPVPIDISSKLNRDTIARNSSEPTSGGYRSLGDCFPTVSFQGSPNIPDNGEVAAANQVFALGNFDGNNTWILAVNQTSTLAVPVDTYSSLTMLFSASGYNFASGHNGTLTANYTDGSTQVLTWDVRDSNGAGNDGLALTALGGMDFYRTGSGLISTNDRSLFCQTFNLNRDKFLASITLSTVGTDDPDAQYGIYAINAVSVVPEPGAMLLSAQSMLAALAILGWRRARVSRRG